MCAFYQSDTDEDTCKCVCGASMRLYFPSPSQVIPPTHALPSVSQLPGFCSICRVQLLMSSCAFECKVKSDKHPSEPYQICYRCARYTQKAAIQKTEHYKYYHNISSPKPIDSVIRQYNNITQFNRFLNTKNKDKHYQQVHELINQASDSAINSIFNQIATLSNRKKRHLLHTIYDCFDAENENKYDMNYNDNRVQNDTNNASIMKDVKQNIIKDDYNLIAGNVNIAYENDDDFILKNAHLLEQQENELNRIKMEQKSKNNGDNINTKIGDLRIAELEDLFGCSIGMNLTHNLGQDLWWYRVFVFLPQSQLSSIMLTCRYFYSIKVYHELVHDHMIRISSLPSLVWKLAIFKDFKIEQKFNKSINYIRIRFMKSMDWTAKLSPNYLKQLDLIQLPDTKQLYIEYSSINSCNLDHSFIKMTNMMFSALLGGMKSLHYIEFINKTNPKKHFTWKMESFNHLISSLNTFNRIKIPCWNQDLFNPRIYSWSDDAFCLNTFRNIEYIYLDDMQFENFASLLPNDNGGLDAVHYFEELQKLKGIVLIFGQVSESITSAVSDSIISLLEILRDTIQYLIVGVNGIRNYIHNPFIDDQVNVLSECYQLYEFNYGFKEQINEIFWNNYVNPDEKYKNEKKLELIKQKEKEEKVMKETMKSMIQLEIQRNYGNINALELSELTENMINDQDDMEIVPMSDIDDDDKEDKYTLQELGNTLSKYQKQERLCCSQGKAAFIVLYNTQIYVDNNDNKIPLNKDASGQWECPFCSVWNTPFSRRCSMCDKKKAKYIPKEVLMQQQAINQQMQYGWDCPMCGANNSDNLNCKLCTFERPKSLE